MANTVSSTTNIELLDGTEVVLRAASIKVLKQIMKVLGKLTEVGPDENAIMDILVEASAVALKPQVAAAGFVDLDAKKDGKDYTTMREQYEELVDMDIVNLVNEICGGVKFDDPNPLAPQKEAVGTN
jgi:hypothetical protein